MSNSKQGVASTLTVKLTDEYEQMLSDVQARYPGVLTTKTAVLRFCLKAVALGDMAPFNLVCVNDSELIAATRLLRSLEAKHHD